MLFQRLGGLFLTVSSTLIMCIEGNGTAALLLVPLGLYLMLTKYKVAY